MLESVIVGLIRLGCIFFGITWFYFMSRYGLPWQLVIMGPDNASLLSILEGFLFAFLWIGGSSIPILIGIGIL